MQSMRKFEAALSSTELNEFCSGCEPLTPDDIAEIVVFAAGRRENVVLAETLVYPNHQVYRPLFLLVKLTLLSFPRSSIPTLCSILLIIPQAAATVLHKKA